MKNEDIESLISELLESANGAIEPSKEQFRHLLTCNLDGPLHFINFLAFKEAAEYPAEYELADDQISGIDAYDKYGAVAFAQILKRGGRILTINNVEQQLIGSSREWHRVVTVEYKNANAFIEMLMDPEYQDALVHRDAGLEATELFVSRPLIAEPIG